MIVRILHEGQFELTDGEMDRLETLDRELLKGVEAGDRDAYHTTLGEILGIVRQGRRLAHDELRSSELVIPAEDFSLEEARALLEPPK